MSDSRTTFEDRIILGAGFEELVAGRDDALAPRLEPFVFVAVDLLAWSQVADA